MTGSPMASSILKMPLQISLRHLLLFQLMVLGAFGQDWSVKYTQTRKCALKGSTVYMSSDYRYPSHLEVVKRFWAINPAKNVEPVDLTTDPEYSGRTEYFEGGNKLFYLKLMNVTERDEHMYCIRITTNIESQRYLFYPGVTLNVTGLRVESPERVSEGNTTRLTCWTTCPLPDRPTYIWYKNGRCVDRNDKETNVLSLRPTRIEDTGSYSCAVRGYEGLPSPAVVLSVRYSPKNISVSISPSGEIVEGSSVTLTCSCNANPPADEYSWFKQKQFLGKGKDYTISNISSEDGGEYKCKTSNAEGQRYSSSVMLNVVVGPTMVHHAVIAIIVSCTIIFFAVSMVFLRRKKMCCWSQDRTAKQENIYSNMAVQTPTNSAPLSNTGPVYQDENQYASIAHHDDGSSASASGAFEEVQYASVQHRRDKVVKKALEEENVPYASVSFNRSPRPAEMLDDPSVIYSTVK
ncbi:B-cell receptor CD22-like isoform X1 [Pygocentrus nattereri]|uniref:Ig-like domain-containing protein n=2 Tax=Pygocentrus nattereri TaxID=42514 RepID=A0AAR2M2G3_PYGNA|nr:B-cell receptor CD22-like isoform X1 [Pygocentrus nattereri]